MSSRPSRAKIAAAASASASVTDDDDDNDVDDSSSSSSSSPIEGNDNGDNVADVDGSTKERRKVPRRCVVAFSLCFSFSLCRSEEVWDGPFAARDVALLSSLARRRHAASRSYVRR